MINTILEEINNQFNKHLKVIDDLILEKLNEYSIILDDISDLKRIEIKGDKFYHYMYKDKRIISIQKIPTITYVDGYTYYLDTSYY